MTNSNVGEMLKEMRGRQTQLSLGLDINLTRETVSKYENGRSKIPSDISNTLMKKYDNPRFAMVIRNEFTHTGAVWLDGPNVDLHRSSVKEKVLEEMNEALEKLNNFCMAKPLARLKHFEYQALESVLEELVEVQTAIEHMVVVVCEEANISYTGLWDRHYKFLASEGYIGGERT